MTSQMVQYAPHPEELANLVANCSYRPGWRITLKSIERDSANTHWESAGGLTLVITTVGFDTYNPDRGETYRVNHYFIVPAATFNRRSWQRWLFDCFCKVELHEAMEFFQIGDTRPFAPTHGPGDDPYVVHEIATDEQVRTNFRGELKA
jgi:hypothetical protein